MTKLSKSEVAALAGKIRAVREKLGMNQGRFARLAGVSQQKVSEWERGLRLRPVVVAWRLADILARTK